MTDGSDAVEVHGDPPSLASLVCEAFVAEGFIHRGEVVATANVIHMKFGSEWHRLTIDCGVIFWRSSNEIPRPWTVEDEGWEFPHTDFGASLGLIGKRLHRYVMASAPGGAAVRFAFEEGLTVVIDNRDDATNLRIERP